MAAAAAAKLKIETAAAKKPAIESTHQREAAEAVKRRAAIAQSAEASAQQKGGMTRPVQDQEGLSDPE